LRVLRDARSGSRLRGGRRETGVLTSTAPWHYLRLLDALEPSAHVNLRGGAAKADAGVGAGAAMKINLAPNLYSNWTQIIFLFFMPLTNFYLSRVSLSNLPNFGVTVNKWR
jgi:hypothetical protein